MRPLKQGIASALLFMLLSCNNENTEKQSSSENKAAALKEENTSFNADSLTMNAYVVYKDSTETKKPGIIVVPEWWGLNDYAKNRAKQLADLDYVAMAVDVYGNGQTAANPDEAMKLAGPFYSDPNMARQRMDAAIAKIKTLPNVDTSQLAAIGYCFGGSFVLNAAKLGSDLDGVVSFHGGLAGPAPDKSKLKAQILVCHGIADSFVPDADSLAFRNGLDSVGAVYNFKSYPDAKHAFTNPDADAYAKKFGMDIGYNQAADKASWEDMKVFFQRIFH